MRSTKRLKLKVLRLAGSNGSLGYSNSARAAGSLGGVAQAASASGRRVRRAAALRALLSAMRGSMVLFFLGHSAHREPAAWFTMQGHPTRAFRRLGSSMLPISAQRHWIDLRPIGRELVARDARRDVGRACEPGERVVAVAAHRNA